jgi:AcrR family transcriptional regulator
VRPPDTRDRILEAAARTVARHGVQKLGMGDVSSDAAVSRGTLYRYFPTRDHLLRTLARHEGRRFQERVAAAVREVEGAERLLVALRFATEHARQHPVLQRLLETDPAFLLQALRQQFPAVRAMIAELFAPLLAQTQPVRLGIARTDQLVDWLTRLLVSAYLFPDPEPAAMARGLTAVYRMLTGIAPARTRRRAPRRRAQQGEQHP